MKKILFFVIGCIITTTIVGQVDNDSLVNHFNEYAMQDSLKANALNKIIDETYLYTKTDSAYILINTLVNYTREKNLKLQTADALITYGNYLRIIGNTSEAISKIEESLAIYESFNDVKGQSIALNNIGQIHKNRWNFNKAIEYHKLALKKSESILDTFGMEMNYASLGATYLSMFKIDQSITYSNKALALAKNINDDEGISIILINLANAYSKKNDYKTTNNYYSQALKIAQRDKNFRTIAGVYTGMCSVAFKEKDYTTLTTLAKKGLEIATKNKLTSDQRTFNYFLYVGYKNLNRPQKALYHYEEAQAYLDSLNIISTEKKLLQFEFDRQKLKDSLLQVEKDFKTQLLFDQEIEKKNTENKYLIIGFLALIIVIGITSFLLYNNMKKKKQLAENEKQIQLQKTENLLKEQELNTIDAMIEGQEKERQRLASDLHDSVGAILAAAKLQFKHLSSNKDKNAKFDELYSKTENLLEEAYQEVRSIAHIKNSGVIAKKGLLPAIQKLAKNASGINNLSIEVEHFGLENRIENTLEIALFRMIQELVTNIIKHANASEATIAITQHDDSINLIVEDNGRGFNTDNITIQEGMGLSSIEKRVEHLEGTLQIDTTPNKGTTIIIDIPL